MSTDDNYYTVDDDTVVRWHIRSDGDLDYTIYTELDGGVYTLPPTYTREQIEELLKDL